MGDVADTLGPDIISALLKDRTFHTEILGECFESGDERLKQTAIWARGMLSRVLVS